MCETHEKGKEKYKKVVKVGMRVVIDDEYITFPKLLSRPR